MHLNEPHCTRKKKIDIAVIACEKTLHFFLIPNEILYEFMFNNGNKWINHYDKKYWKLQLIVTIIDRSGKSSFAGTISNVLIG